MPTILERYVQQHKKSAELFEQSKGLFPDGVTHDARYAVPFHIFVTHAEGPRKWDVDGNEYIDFFGGHGALILGHSHPEIVKAVQEQVARGTHLGANHEVEIRWAQWVKTLIPSAEKVRFHSSGTEATMMAVRLARAYTGKTKLLKFQEHFHGWHDYVVPGSGSAPGGVPAATMATTIVLPANDIKLVERILQQDTDVAAIILEPTGGHGGSVPVYPSFLKELREIATKYKVVLIFDEVVTGFRVSKGGAQYRYGVTPDLTSLAKILAGGLPGGAVAGKAEVMDMIAHRGDPQWDSTRRIGHPGTFNANPLSAAAGAKCLELVATGEPNAKADAAAKRLKDGINGLLTKLEIPGHAHGVASNVHLKLGLECGCDREVCTAPVEKLKRANPPKLMPSLRRAFLNAGVDPAGGAHFIVSSTHTDKAIDQALKGVEEALRAVRAEGLI